MALPTAQLGSLGNMSMPYSIPTYEKGPGVLEKAIASFLVNAASGVAQRGAENVMSRDYAKEFGEDPAKGFGRLLGPKVGERDAQLRRQNTFNTNESQKDRDFRSSENVLNGMQQAGRDQVAAEERRGLQESEIDARTQSEGVRMMNELLQSSQNNDARMALEMEQNLGREAQIASEYKARAGLPSEQMSQLVLDRMRKQMGGGGGASGQTPDGAAAVNPNIAKFAQGGAATGASAAPAGPQGDFVSNQDDVAKLLAQGYTPEDIMRILTRQQDTNDAAQKLPLPDINAQSTQPQLDPELLKTLQGLGLLAAPGVPEMPVNNFRQLR